MIGDGDEILGWCERGVEKGLARGADQAEVYWEEGASLDLELERGELSSTGSGRERGGAVRLVKDGRRGFSYFTARDGLEDAIARALDAARRAPKKDFSLPAGSAPPRLGDRWDGDVASMPLERALGDVKDVLAGVGEGCPDAKLTGGGISYGASLEAVASSEGVACWDRQTMVSAGAALVLEAGDHSISTWDSRDQHAMGLDCHALGVLLGEKTRSLAQAEAEAGGGRYDLVMNPEATHELLLNLVTSAANGHDALERKSVWSDRLGEVVADSRLTIADDPLHEEAIGSVPFDAEGLPAQRVAIVEDGVLSNFLFDCWDGHRHGRPSTHSAVRANYRSLPSTGTHHMVVTGRDGKRRDRLVAEVEDGFLVDSLLGAHTANATTGDFSVTAPNVWRIRGGEVVGPSPEVAVSGNMADLLQRLDGVSRDVRIQSGARVPAMRFNDVEVSI